MGGGRNPAPSVQKLWSAALLVAGAAGPGFFQGLIGVIANEPSRSSLFPSNKAHFHILSTLLTRRSVEVESHGPSSRSVSGPAPLLFQVHRLHQSLCPLNSARKCSDGRLRDFGIHFKDGRKVLHNFKNAPALPCPTQAAVASSSSSQKRGMRRLMSTSLSSILPHTHTHTLRDGFPPSASLLKQHQRQKFPPLLLPL